MRIITAELMREIKRREWKWLCASLIVGFVCHSYVFYNTLIFHDDACLRFKMPYDTPMQNGRWFFSFLVFVFNYFLGSEGIPLFLGLFTFLFIAFSWLVAVKLFGMEDALSRIISLVFFNVLPCTASNFGYFTTCIYNFIGAFVCILGAALVCKSEKILSFKYIVGCFMIATAIGEYQCMLCFAGTIIILYYSTILFDKILASDSVSFKDMFFWGLRYLLSLGLSLLIYLAILQFSLRLTGIELTSYAGIDTYGIVPFQDYLKRIMTAYNSFIRSGIPQSYCLFPFSNRIWHRLFLITLTSLVICSFCILAIKSKRIDSGKTKCSIFLLYVLSVCLIPLAIESMFVLYDPNRVHSLHTYSYIGVFLWCLILLKRVCSKSTVVMCYKLFIYTYLIILGILFFRYDNLCYLQMDIMQERSKSYFTELKTRIQSVENYNSNYPILFVNDREKNTHEMTSSISESDIICTNPFFGQDIPNGYAWDHFMYVWTGWWPSRTDVIDATWIDLIDDMPSYPDCGSIIVIDDVVIVKF